MNFEFSAEGLAFRSEVRQFLREHLPPSMARRAYCGFTPPPKEDLQAWNRILYEKGWAAPHWPPGLSRRTWIGMRCVSAAERIFLR